ncbi:MAG: hypothetical protein Kow0092_21710 [Deferrisomatales bacterium]
MVAFVHALLRHKPLAVAASGLGFLAAAAAIRIVPGHYVARATVSAVPNPGLADSVPAGGRVRFSVRPQGTGGPWAVEVTAPTEGEARQGLRALLESWQKTVAEVAPKPAEPAATEAIGLLEEKRRMLREQLPPKETLERKVAALEAASLAVAARLDALGRDVAEHRDPVGALLASLRQLQRTLAGALAPDHPDLVQLSREIAELEAASASQAEFLALARQLAVFQDQMEELVGRYAPGHPEVRRKAAELASVERRLRALREGRPPLLPASGESELLQREKTYWEAERRALIREGARARAQLAQIETLEEEIAALEAELPPKAAAPGAAKPQVRVVSGPSVAPEFRPAGTWIPWALGASFLLGGLAAVSVHGRGSRVWEEEDLPAGPWGDHVLSAPSVCTVRARAVGAAKVALSATPWLAAVSLFALG